MLRTYLCFPTPNRNTEGELRSVGSCGATQSWTTLDEEKIATLDDIDTACAVEDPCDDECGEFEVCGCSRKQQKRVVWRSVSSSWWIGCFNTVGKSKHLSARASAAFGNEQLVTSCIFLSSFVLYGYPRIANTGPVSIRLG